MYAFLFSAPAFYNIDCCFVRALINRHSANPFFSSAARTNKTQWIYNWQLISEYSFKMKGHKWNLCSKIKFMTKMFLCTFWHNNNKQLTPDHRHTKQSFLAHIKLLLTGD